MTTTTMLPKRLTITVTYKNRRSLGILLDKIANRELQLGVYKETFDEAELQYHLQHIIPFQEPTIQTINGIECMVYKSNF
jgi:hypothetical protein